MLSTYISPPRSVYAGSNVRRMLIIANGNYKATRVESEDAGEKKETGFYDMP